MEAKGTISSISSRRLLLELNNKEHSSYGRWDRNPLNVESGCAMVPKSGLWNNWVNLQKSNLH